MAMIALATLSSAQNNSTTCTDCVFTSIHKDSSCINLDTEIQSQLKLVFGNNNTINEKALSAAIKNPIIKTCVCHWTATAFMQGGAASSCLTGAPVLCSASSVSLIQAGISLAAPILECDNVTTTGASGGGGVSPTPTSGVPGKAKGAGQVSGGVLAAIAGLVGALVT
ncbi:hypothetical protein BGZ52_005863 [Haplosporangium bisporale]|nr:hypothetical protein BGZ52_005863 [Haplosporangium bisporale]KFH67024.1 hypothetical protein MVEG_07548 [Podila verticillata NRRL 6337]